MVSSGGFCYATEVSTASTNNQTLQNQFTASNQIQDFHHDHDHQANDQIFMDNNNLWKGFDNNNDKAQNHHHDQFSDTAGGDLIVGPDHSMRPFMVDESGLRTVFPCENERPIQGLSLTLSSDNPSTIGLQSFEVRPTASQIHQGSNLQGLAQIHHHHHLIPLRNSKFLTPTQELLNEFCSLGRNNNLSDSNNNNNKLKSHNSKLQWELDLHDNLNGNNNNNNNDGASSSKKHSLYSLEFMELQKRKAKLLSMLEEVERRYKKYCDQMRAVVMSFEAVAGPGAAAVYSALALKAMSRHFRCLKDGIASQIEATRKAMGEKAEVGPGPGPGVPGTTRGETPRLRILDQTMRQQRAFQQMNLMESHPWRPQRGLPERSVSVLRAWLFEHFLHPYPSDVDKHILARQTGLSRSQVSNWFINARVRLWKPMVEEMYVEETKEVEILDSTNMAGAGSSSDAADILGMDPTAGGSGARSDHRHLHHHNHDQKPTVDQLVRIDSECLSSIVNNPPPDKTDALVMRNSKTLAQATHDLQRHQSFGRFADHHSYNTMELDFSSYPYPNDPNQGFIGGGGGGGTAGVSLTLGLQQHHHHHHQGVSLAFSPNSQSSMFYPRSSSDHNPNHNHNHHNHHHHGNSNIDDQVPAVQYSILDGDQGQNLPYRNLMGAQLLHDLA